MYSMPRKLFILKHLVEILYKYLFNKSPDIDYGKKGAPLPPAIKNIMISANYEFSGKKHVEWCDGEEFDGGQSIRKVEITKTRLKLVVVNGFNFEVTFNTNDITFQKIVAFLLYVGE